MRAFWDTEPCSLVAVDLTRLHSETTQLYMPQGSRLYTRRPDNLNLTFKAHARYRILPELTKEEAEK